MADISQIKLPSGSVYNLKDAYARQLIAGGVTFIVAWNGSSAPVVADIPAGVVVKYNNTNYTGTLSTANAQAGAFYLVKSSTQIESLDVYDEYIVAGSGNSKFWEKLGDTQLDLSSLGALAYKDNVTLNKGDGDNVLGESTTFTNSTSTVTFSSSDKVLGESTTFALTSGSVTHGTPTTDSVLGADTTFAVTQPTISVTPSTTNIKATASGTAVGANGTAAAITGFGAHTTDNVLGSDATFTTTVTPTTTNIKATASGTALSTQSDTFFQIDGDITPNQMVASVGINTSRLDTTTVPNVTAVGSASTWAFSLGSDNTGTGGSDESETLIISGANSTVPTLGTAITAATGSLSNNGSGDLVGTTLTVESYSTKPGNAITSASVSTQPTIALSTGATAGTGVISVATGITSASTVTNSKDEVAAITALGTPTTANALTGVKVTSQPTIALATGATAGTGVISVATGITSASASGAAVSANTNDSVTAVTGMPTSTVGTAITVGTNDKVTVGQGTATAAAQTITVGTGDKVKVAKYNDLSVSVS